jgi:hypothetical protein
MNLHNWKKNVTTAGGPALLRRRPGAMRLAERFFGQSGRAGLSCEQSSMSLSFARKAAICFCWGLFLVIPAAVFGQTNYYTTNGTEYAIAGLLPGDQVWPDVALGNNGGFVVWQDNATDGSGWGVSATRLDSTLSAVSTWSDKRVNVTGTNDQENARVAVLKNGGAVFVWEGGVAGFQHIYARFLTPTNTWLTTTDVVVSVPTNNFQINPAVAVLNNSNVVVVWSSFNEAGSGSLQDVYGQVFSQAGQKIGDEFLVNQFTSYNQRTPGIAALAGGGFVVTWVSEQQRTVAPVLGTNSTFSAASTMIVPSVDIYARCYQSNGAAAGNEFLVNSGYNPCANPAVAAADDNGFMVAWSARDMVAVNNGWDVYARSFSTNGTGGNVKQVNSYLAGSQYAPHLRAIGLDYLVVWTSLNQDGSRDGVYGQFVHNDGTPVGGEFRVNTTWVGQQMQPAVASDGATKFLVVWSSFTGNTYSLDLFAQRFINVNLASNLPPLGAPFVWVPFVLSNGVYQPQLQVSWAALAGISVSNYQVYADGTNSPTALVAGPANQWTMTAANGLAANSTHRFQVAYTTASGRQSPMSAAATNSTWSGASWGGIPYEWMTEMFGRFTNNWPAPNVPPSNSPSGSPTVSQLFLSGGIPYEPATWLHQKLSQTSQGMFLTWNTQPGLTYQVQQSTNLVSWFNLGSPRFAAGTNDSIYAGGSAGSYYQVLLQR